MLKCSFGIFFLNFYVFFCRDLTLTKQLGGRLLNCIFRMIYFALKDFLNRFYSHEPTGGSIVKVWKLVEKHSFYSHFYQKQKKSKLW